MKLTKHVWVLWGISLLIVLTMAWILPFTHTTIFYLALCCTVAMFGLCACTFSRAFRKEDTLESKIIGWPIFKVGYTATLVQIVACFVLMALSALCPLWVAILLEILLFGGTLFCLTVKDAAREAVTHAEATTTDQTVAWKAIRARANALVANGNHPELRKLVEEIRYADPNPCSMDASIAQQLELIAENASAEAIAHAFELLRQRKNCIKAEK